jgi:HD-GYP domain-containing protein (c-di-GMP phosphodiesterase class II)
MIELRQILKPKMVRPHLERALALLPDGSALAVRSGEQLIAGVGEGCEAMLPEGEGVMTFSLRIDDQEIGLFLLKNASTDEALGATLLDFAGNALQGLAQAEHTRKAVAGEALQSYREMALLQRAVQSFSQSLKPETVARILLQETSSRAARMEFGAVYLQDGERGGFRRLCVLGDHADALFDKLEELDLQRLLTTTPGILNDIAHHPKWPLKLDRVGALLLLPLVSNDEKLGALVLGGGTAEAFASSDLKRAETLTSVAGTAIRNAHLFAAQKTMFHSFVDVMSSAIDAASPFTGGHCLRVPQIVQLIAHAVEDVQEGPFRDVAFSEEGWEELQLAASLHDCGKVNTPSWLIDKSTKLETVMDRIELILSRLELLKRHLVLTAYEAWGGTRPPNQDAGAELAARLQALAEDADFLTSCNLGKIAMTEATVDRLHRLAGTEWSDVLGGPYRLIEERELEGLLIKRGTLTDKERTLIEDHVRHTIRMLSKIPFPAELKNVASYAGGHHERVDGKGYPLGVGGDGLPLQSRIIALADVFEALTAPDRPYRSPLSLSRALDILADMSRTGHIDPDLFRLFIRQGVYRIYAHLCLSSDQIDAVDENRYLSLAVN